jgi:hypothetical protein
MRFITFQAALVIAALSGVVLVPEAGCKGSVASSTSTGTDTDIDCDGPSDFCGRPRLTPDYGEPCPNERLHEGDHSSSEHPAVVRGVARVR